MARLFGDGKQAPSIYHLGGADAPRSRGLFFIRFVCGDTVSESSRWVNDVAYLVKSVEQPRVQLKTEELNQYNKKRIVYTGSTYTPIAISFNDTASATAVQMWSDYIRYYFGDFNQNIANYTYDIVSGVDDMKGMDAGYGYRPRTGLSEEMDISSQYYFTRIEIYQVFRNSFTRTILVNPKIIDYSADELDYSQSEAATIKMSLSYEGFMYDNGGAPQSIYDDPILIQALKGIRLYGDPVEVTGQPGISVVQNKYQNPLSPQPSTFNNSVGQPGLFDTIKNIAGGGGLSGLGGVLSSFGDFDFGRAAGTVAGSILSGRTKDLPLDVLISGTNSPAIRHIAGTIQNGLNTETAIGIAQTYTPGINPAVYDAARAAIAIKNGDKFLAGGMAQQAVMGILGSSRLNDNTTPQSHVGNGMSNDGYGRGMSLSPVAINAINSSASTRLIGNNNPVGNVGSKIVQSVAKKIPGLSGAFPGFRR